VYSCENLARFPRCVGNSWKKLWGVFRKSNIDFNLKGGQCKAWRKDQQTLLILHQCLDDATFEKVAIATTAN
jgi:hypothetical protein